MYPILAIRLPTNGLPLLGAQSAAKEPAATLWIESEADEEDVEAEQFLIARLQVMTARGVQRLVGRGGLSGSAWERRYRE